MRLFKKLIVAAFCLTFILTAADFRGKKPAAIRNGQVPLAFKPFLETGGANTEQLHFMRGSYLIITPAIFQPYLVDFVQFKRSQGFDVSVANLTTTGVSPTAIKTYIQNALAADPMLEYVLLIGDVDGTDAMPSFYYGPENDVSDQKYTHLIGDDFIPDVFIGRLSVDSITELIVAIQKTIKYHRTPLATNGDWLNRALIVAGNYSNTVPIPITPVWTSHWLREVLLDHGYSAVDTVFYPPVQYGAPQIQAAINAGVGIVNYRGWGDANGWHYPEFHVNDLANLNNGWMTPVFTSFVCNANDFANNVDPCLGEAIIRSGSPTNPKGGVAVIGPSDLHTSTKYNNIINSYMYDAIYDMGVHELAPAMLQGLLGLIREFPDQEGPGEAQEFYFHVYNLLGDPSLAIHTGTPDVFTISVDSDDVNGGCLNLEATDSQGQPVDDAVVAVMNGSDLLFKGMTDGSGRFTGNFDVSLAGGVNVYLSKPGFIQGLVNIDIPGDDVTFSGYSLDGGSPFNIACPTGIPLDIYPVIRNNRGTAIPAGTGTLTGLPGITIIQSTFSFGAIGSMESGIASTPATVLVTDNYIGGDALVAVHLTGESINGKIGLKVIPPELVVDLQSQAPLVPNTDFTPVIAIDNRTGFSWSNLSINLTAVSDYLEVTMPGTSPTVTIEPWSSTELTLGDILAHVGDLSWGSAITIEVQLLADSVAIYSKRHHIQVVPASSDHPVNEVSGRYWAYDDLDTGYPEAPTFSWIELDPSFGGSGGTEHLIDDDAQVTEALPFTFRYYGVDYEQVTICSNGWISMVPCDINYFWNYTIPMALGPKAQIAVFWDDLEVVGTDLIRVYTRYDATEGRYVIEWSRALNNFDETSVETFEVILYDPAIIQTTTGDGVIDMQYLEVHDVDITKNYATVGIEDHFQNAGIQYTFNNTYAPGAAVLENGRVIRFTPNAPSNYQAPLAIKPEMMPDDFALETVYPNPFNSATRIDYRVDFTQPVNLAIYDILGKQVANLVDGIRESGRQSVYWQGRNSRGEQVSSGTYIIVLRSGDRRLTQKLLYLK